MNKNFYENEQKMFTLAKELSIDLDTTFVKFMKRLTEEKVNKLYEIEVLDITISSFLNAMFMGMRHIKNSVKNEEMKEKIDLIISDTQKFFIEYEHTECTTKTCSILDH